MTGVYPLAVPYARAPVTIIQDLIEMLSALRRRLRRRRGR
jgi:hypothetical protein